MIEEAQVVDVESDGVGKVDAPSDQTEKTPKNCCRKFVQKCRSVRQNPRKAEAEEVDPQSIVVFNLATTLYIFVYYLQVLGIITSDLIVDLPDIWNELFGWIRFPALTALFPQFRFDADWQLATVTLFGLYSFPVLLFILFTMSLNLSGTDLNESKEQLKYTLGV